MSDTTLRLTLAFKVGRSPGSPGTLRLPMAFRVGVPPGQPGTLRLTLSFAVRSLGSAGTLRLPLSFAIKGPDPTIFLFDSSWQPVVQRAWSGTGWFPGVT
jgi:hypothetical protein